MIFEQKTFRYYLAIKIHKNYIQGKNCIHEPKSKHVCSSKQTADVSDKHRVRHQIAIKSWIKTWIIKRFINSVIKSEIIIGLKIVHIFV